MARAETLQRIARTARNVAIAGPLLLFAAQSACAVEDQGTDQVGNQPQANVLHAPSIFDSTPIPPFKFEPEQKIITENNITRFRNIVGAVLSPEYSNQDLLARNLQALQTDLSDQDLVNKFEQGKLSPYGNFEAELKDERKGRMIRVNFLPKTPEVNQTLLSVRVDRESKLRSFEEDKVPTDLDTTAALAPSVVGLSADLPEPLSWHPYVNSKGEEDPLRRESKEVVVHGISVQFIVTSEGYVTTKLLTPKGIDFSQPQPHLFGKQN